MKLFPLVLAFAVPACVDADQLDETSSEVGIGPTTVTFYESSNFTGRSYSTSLASPDLNERIKLISKPDIEAALLFGKISSVKLSCGARDGRIVLFDAYNASNTSFAAWSHLGGTGYTINCTAGRTTSVNLHTARPALADHVASAFLVTHAGNANHMNFTDIFESAWAVALDDLPSAATPTRTEMWLETTNKFRIRQFLTLDHWACTERGAVFDLRVTLNQTTGAFSAAVVESYVNYGTGDLWGCRDKMQATLDESLVKAKAKLTAGLDKLIDTLVNDRARYYFAPDVHLTAFDLFYEDAEDSPGNAPE